MAVTDTTPKISCTADGSVGATYSIPFKLQDASHLDMYVDGVKVVGGKTVNGAGTGTVTVNTDTDYASGVVILFRRNVPYAQETVLSDGAEIPADSLEDAIDNAVMQIQQVKEQADRGIGAGEAETAPGGTISQAADTTLGQDSSGNLISRTATQEVDHLGIGTSVTAAAASAAAAATSETNAATSATNAATSETNAATSATASETSNVNASNAVLDLSSKSFQEALFYTTTGDSAITGDVVISLTGAPDITIKNSARPYTEDNAINGVGSKLSQLWPDVVKIIQGHYTDYDTSIDYGDGLGPTISNPNPITGWDVKSYAAPYDDSILYKLIYYGSETSVDLSAILPSPYVAVPSTLAPPSDLPYLDKVSSTELSEAHKANLADQWPEAIVAPHLIDTFQRDSNLTGEIGSPENGVEADYSLWGTQVASARVDNGRFYNADGAASAVHVTWQKPAKSMFAQIAFKETVGAQFGQVALLWQSVQTSHSTTHWIHAIWDSKRIEIYISDTGVDFDASHLVFDWTTATLNGRLQAGETLDVGMVIGPETLTVIDPRLPGGSHVIKTDLIAPCDAIDMYPCWEVFDSEGLQGEFEAISASPDPNFRPPWFSDKPFSGPRESDGLFSVYALGDPSITGSSGQWSTEAQHLAFPGALFARAGEESVASELLEEVTDDADNEIFVGGLAATTTDQGTSDVLELKIPASHSGSAPLLVNHGDSLEYTFKAFVYGAGATQVIKFDVSTTNKLTITPNARATSFVYEPVDVIVTIRKVLVGVSTKYAVTVTGILKDQDTEMWGDLLNSVENSLTLEYDCSGGGGVGFFLIYQASCKRISARVVS